MSPRQLGGHGGMRGAMPAHDDDDTREAEKQASPPGQANVPRPVERIRVR